MKRTKLHTLDSDSAIKRIETAKSNKPFMRALQDRSNSSHKDALAHWTRLHEAAFKKPESRTSESPVERAGSDSGISAVPSTAAGRRTRHSTIGESGRQSETLAMESHSTRRSANGVPGAGSSGGERLNARRRAAAHESEQASYPDPGRPLDIDQSVISPFLHWRDESESDWLRRLKHAASGPHASIERLAIIREAILREIGFYDLDSGPAADRRSAIPSAWSVLATLQNVPLDGWQSALPLGDDAREEFEQTGTLPYLGVLGPDGNVYNRLSIDRANPVGDLLTTVDERIRMAQLADPIFDVGTLLPAVALSLPAIRGGGSARPSLATTVAPRVYQYIRSRGGIAAAGFTTGLGLGTAANEFVEGAGRSDMEAAPDLPPPSGFEPERPEQEHESFPADLPDIPPLPGFMPEDYPDLVTIFPDQRDELPFIDILDRWGSPETQLFNSRTMRGVRDLARTMGIKVWHRGGGRHTEDSDYEKEHRLPGPGGGTVGSSYLDIAFESKRTGRKLLINTIDTRADNATPTSREERAAVRILKNSETGDILILLPKPPRGQTYDLDRFLEWLRPHLEEIDRDLPEGSEGHQRRFDFH